LANLFHNRAVEKLTCNAWQATVR